MFDDDDPKPKRVDRPNLEVMSIEALNEYIAELRAEIERAQAMIAQKQDLRGAAESLFRR